jgi:transcription elongation factor GreB
VLQFENEILKTAHAIQSLIKNRKRNFFMSKAFTKEPDPTLEEDDEIPEPSIPKGSKNYITPQGFKRLQDELHKLLHDERPALTAVVAWAAGNGDRSENADYIYGKRRLREIDRRIRFLQKRLEAAEVVEPVRQSGDQVFFGATVTVRDEDGNEKTVTIVGVDEIELEKNRISWVSPLALALRKARVGEVVSFRSPKGARELEVIEIVYRALD